MRINDKTMRDEKFSLVYLSPGRKMLNLMSNDSKGKTQMIFLMNEIFRG